MLSSSKMRARIAASSSIVNGTTAAIVAVLSDAVGEMYSAVPSAGGDTSLLPPLAARRFGRLALRCRLVAHAVPPVSGRAQQQRWQMATMLITAASIKISPGESAAGGM